jgi:A/G-specific adenine glycosylase
MKKETGIRRRLLSWFDAEKRDLPWRRTKDPYKIWISEIMLQQTRVETVIPYYERFLEAFPTVKTLAHAPEDRVLKQWEGLGYYSRARNLQKAARIIVSDFQGRFPSTFDEIQSLPGIGKYTAGAISSIAFGLKEVALDGNVKRVLSRVYAVEEWIEKNSTLQFFEERLVCLLSPTRPGDFNEALMELGARVCVPRKPLCHECPIPADCEGYRQNRAAEFPVRKPKKPIPHLEVVAAAIKKKNRYLLGKRPATSMLSGLWEFPGGKVEEGETHQEALKRELREEMGIEVRVKDFLVSVDHAYSHYTVTLHLYLCEHVSGQPKTLYHSDLKWLRKSQFEEYPFPAANIKFFPYL